MLCKARGQQSLIHAKGRQLLEGHGDGKEHLFLRIQLEQVTEIAALQRQNGLSGDPWVALGPLLVVLENRSYSSIM